MSEIYILLLLLLLRVGDRGGVGGWGEGCLFYVFKHDQDKINCSSNTADGEKE